MWVEFVLAGVKKFAGEIIGLILLAIFWRMFPRLRDWAMKYKTPTKDNADDAKARRQQKRRNEQKRRNATRSYSDSLNHSVRSWSAYRQKFGARKNYREKKRENLKRLYGNLK